MDFISNLPHDIITFILSQTSNQTIINFMSTSKTVWKNNNLWLRLVQVKKYKKITKNYKNDYKTNYILQKFLFTNNSQKMFEKDYLYLGNIRQLEIPNEIVYLKKCKNIIIDSCTIKNINSIYKLNPTSLSLSTLRINKIPNKLVNFTELTYLDLSYNNLKTLPEEFGKLCNLQELFLDNNKLKILPNEFIKLQKLTLLNLSNNKLGTLPFSFKEFKNLQNLDISGNPKYKKIDN